MLAAYNPLPYYQLVNTNNVAFTPAIFYFVEGRSTLPPSCPPATFQVSQDDRIIAQACIHACMHATCSTATPFTAQEQLSAAQIRDSASAPAFFLHALNCEIHSFPMSYVSCTTCED